ncbi:MAG: hypothetical protein R2705_16110 [Ilumatobacteraceae bacterium]
MPPRRAASTTSSTRSATPPWSASLKPGALAKFADKYRLSFCPCRPRPLDGRDLRRVAGEEALRQGVDGHRAVTFLVAAGTLEQVWYKISPKDTPTRNLLAAVNG